MDNEKQKEIFRNMTPAQKINAANLLIHSVRQLKYAQYKKEFSNLSDAEITEKVKKYFMYAST
jgi:hypothetical protein